MVSVGEDPHCYDYINGYRNAIWRYWYESVRITWNSVRCRYLHEAHREHVNWLHGIFVDQPLPALNARVHFSSYLYRTFARPNVFWHYGYRHQQLSALSNNLHFLSVYHNFSSKSTCRIQTNYFTRNQKMCCHNLSFFQSANYSMERFFDSTT